MAVQKLLLMKKETVYDTDPTPDDSNAIQTIDLNVKRYAGDKIERNLDRHILGGQEQININPHAMLSFGVELASSGAAGTAPPIGPALLACGFDENVTPATDVQYQLPADQSDLLDCDSVTCWSYLDAGGLVQKTTGVRGGGLSLTMSRGELPRLNFSDMLGTYNTPVAASMPTGIDWSGWRDPLRFTKANIPTLTLDSVASCVESMEIDFGLQAGRRNLPNCQSTRITGYQTTGQMKISVPDISTKDWYSLVESHNGTNTVAFSLQVGNTSGDIVTLTASSVQVIDIDEDEMADGDPAFNLSFSFIDRPILTYK